MRFRELTNILAYMSLKRFILSEELQSCQVLFSGKTVDGPGVDGVQETADGPGDSGWMVQELYFTCYSKVYFK